MLIKIYHTYIETDEIVSISEIKKYSGAMFFNIYFRNKTEHEVSWNIAQNVDEEDVLRQKLELLRKEIVRIKNKSEIIIEVGQSISLKKPKIASQPKKVSK